jgi:predicted AAA+ superfamily ATPase
VIPREIKNLIVTFLTGFPVIGLIGPRQSGKTTLMKSMFPEYKYINLESPDVRSFIESDPAGFIKSQHNVMIDEVQRMPELLSYIQAAVDERQRMGDFIISGSENLLMSEKISQSLAGRAAYATLLPLSISELMASGNEREDLYGQILRGFYPAVYSRNVSPFTYYDQYVATYVERDLKNISNIRNLSLFRKFLALLAGRIGQVVNYQSLSNDVGVSPKIIESWISVLEACYLVIRLRPYHSNFGKRYIKSPKIFFTDTGLACYLLGIRDRETLSKHYLIGGLFENLCIMDIHKRILNTGSNASLYFFRDSNHNEVDLIIDTGIPQIPVEMKSSATFTPSYGKGIRDWKSVVPGSANQSGFIVYSGNDKLENADFSLLNWSELNQIVF